MRPSLLPRLVNGPFEDPALFIRILFKNRAILFDLGDIQALSTRDILKISHVFVTHTHMDHFIGFDRLLRIFLGRNKKLHLFGPRGFIRNVEGKLSAYQWNLVENFTHQLSIEVTEVTGERMTSQVYDCRDRFQPRQAPEDDSASSCLLKEPGLSVYAVALDHRIPCLGLCIEEAFHINIKKDALTAMDLVPGPWIQTFKQALFENRPLETPIRIPRKNTVHQLSIGALRDKIAIISPGQKISYITDVRYTQANVDPIIHLATGSDHMFIESAFMEKDRDVALRKYHLTAKQAGRIAALAQAKKMTPFHFSPRYTGDACLLEAEARESYNEVRNAPGQP